LNASTRSRLLIIQLKYEARDVKTPSKRREIRINPQTDDANLIGIAPEVSGHIVKINVKDNQFVRKMGILLGLLVMWLVFDALNGPSAGL